MSVKTILVAHQDAAVRDRVAAALADARHACVPAPTEAAAVRAAGDRSAAVSLALVDLSIAADGVAFVRALREAAGRPIPIVVFAGSVPSAGAAAELAAVPVSGYLNESAGLAAILPALAPHLFPDNFNRRTGPRITLAVPVSFQAGSALTAGTSLNVGTGGLGVRTMDPLPKGTALELVFRLPGQPGDVKAASRVAWSDRNVGMGLRFEQIDADSQETVEGFIGTRRP
jgi:uncharacterized protein (TIGR02266 family)